LIELCAQICVFPLYYSNENYSNEKLNTPVYFLVLVQDVTSFLGMKYRPLPLIKQPLEWQTPLIALVIIIWLSAIGNAKADQIEPKKIRVPQALLRDAPDEFRSQFLPKLPPPYKVAKRSGHYSLLDWKRAIDSTWGPSESPEMLGYRFNYFWKTIDERYACFQDLDVN
jgi:hypothetical protein